MRGIVVILGAMPFIGVGCSSDSARSLAAACSINTDCQSPLVCAFQRCHNACTDSRDCSNGERCVLSDKPFRVCQLPDETSCTRSSDCPGAETCAIDRECRDACVTTADCVTAQVCVSLTCADPKELADGGLVPKGDAGIDVPCAYNSECATPFVCRSGVCQFECLDSRDCSPGSSCVAHVCEAQGNPNGSGGQSGSGGASGRDASAPGSPGTLGAACNYPSDCEGALRCGPRGTCVYECNTTFDCAVDQCCSAHRCESGIACDRDASIVVHEPDAGGGKACAADLDCQDGVVCNGFERCLGGRCRPAAKTACDDSDPCTVDICDEKSGGCTHRVAGPVDEDGDGHYAIGAACGADSGLADDCDDHNPNVYPGHPELCDEVDNNCNGIPDEGVWQLGPATALTTSGAFHVSAAVGPDDTPAVAAVAGGFDVVATADATTGVAEAFRLSTAGQPLASAALFTSAGVDCAPTSGKQVSNPTLASDGTNLLLALTNQVPVGACCAQAGEADWTRSLLGVLAPGSLATPGTNLEFDVEADAACSFPNPASNLGTPHSVWLPSLGKYAVAWADSHAGNGPHAWVATVSASGVLGGAHTVTASESDAALYALNQAPLVLLSASPTRLLVTYYSQASMLRMVLLDAATLSAVVGPMDLPNSFQAEPLGSEYSDGHFFIFHSTRGTLDVSAVDATTLAVARTGSISVAGSSLYSPHLTPVGNGVFVAFSRSATALSYGWAPGNVATTSPEIFPLTDMDFGKNVSAAGVAALDARHVAVVWSDGDVKAAIASCGP